MNHIQAEQPNSLLIHKVVPAQYYGRTVTQLMNHIQAEQPNSLLIHIQPEQLNHIQAEQPNSLLTHKAWFRLVTGHQHQTGSSIQQFKQT
jgi:hypothetical protein